MTNKFNKSINKYGVIMDDDFVILSLYDSRVSEIETRQINCGAVVVVSGFKGGQMAHGPLSSAALSVPKFREKHLHTLHFIRFH